MLRPDMLGDLQPTTTQVVIQGLQQVAKPNSIQLLVEHGILDCVDGYFYPEQTVTGSDVMQAFDRLKKLENQ